MRRSWAQRAANLGRDEQSWASRAARFYYHDRSLHLLSTKNKQKYPADLKPAVEASLKRRRRPCRRGALATRRRPLLFSVRFGGARVHLPGMMDTGLNLGSPPENGRRPGELTEDERFRLRFLSGAYPEMYSGVVLRSIHCHFEEILENEKPTRVVELDTIFDAARWRRIAELLQGEGAEGLGPAVPRRFGRAIVGPRSARYSVPGWGGARGTYRPPQQYPRGLGHGGSTSRRMVFRQSRCDVRRLASGLTRDPSDPSGHSTVSS